MMMMMMMMNIINNEVSVVTALTMTYKSSREWRQKLLAYK